MNERTELKLCWFNCEISLDDLARKYDCDCDCEYDYSQLFKLFCSFFCRAKLSKNNPPLEKCTDEVLKENY